MVDLVEGFALAFLFILVPLLGGKIQHCPQFFLKVRGRLPVPALKLG
jgi:hypothetical protein